MAAGNEPAAATATPVGEVDSRRFRSNEQLHINSNGHITSQQNSLPPVNSSLGGFQFESQNPQVISHCAHLGYLKSAASQSVELAKYCESSEDSRGRTDLTRGSVTLDNATFRDKICENEFKELLNVLLNSRYLLKCRNVDLTGDLPKHKHILLALLVSLNWGVYDPTTQFRLIKAMEDRISKTQMAETSTQTYEFFHK